GMAHSGNDYLIAMMGVKANIEIERESYLYPSLPIHQSGKARRHVSNQGRGGVIGIKQAMRALYIVMKFPKYDADVSDFEGTVRIAQKSANGAYGIVTLSVANGKKYPIITLLQQPDKDSFFVQRGEPLAITEFKKEFIKNRVGRVEAYNEAIDKKTKQKLGYYEILYKVGEFFIMREGKVQIYYKLKYWHHGRTTQDKNGNPIENKPILLSYSYDL
ncbi:hypothetical protein, partial [Candidatus Schmidhempelia bombi]|uniref:hypothetical protein n=1 Tax=Candidatus Schmidhempelia bombi TaxID=1505866 RepID=UPI001416ED88